MSLAVARTGSMLARRARLGYIAPDPNMDAAPPPPNPAAVTPFAGADTGTAPAPATRRPRLRTAGYCLILACLASVLMFRELGADALTGDEAQYALVVQNILRSGDWLYVSPYPPTPYLQKPPLYFWLTAATYDALGGPDEFAYRAWSAAAGVGAVVLTCVLGAMLLGPELGAVAGLLLLTNRSFLLVHGARSGTFDALVTLFVVAGAVLYWAAARRGLPWLGWAGIGVVAGLASMTKPFVGVPLVVLLAVHSLVVRRTSPSRGRLGTLGGPLVALVVLAAVAAPWCVAQWRKYPKDFSDEFFRRNMVDRALRGVDDKHVEEWDYYIEQVGKSSIPFLLAIPASLYAAYSWARGPRREEYALLVVLGAGWVVLFSFSASKAAHYVYPAFPFLAVMVAAGAACVGRLILDGTTPTTRPRLALGAAAVVLAGFTFQFARTLYVTIPADRSPYVPWEMYRTLAPAIRAGAARVVFCGFPDLQAHWRDLMGLGARDCYYLEQMRPGAAWLKQPGELADLLHTPVPTLLIVSRRTDGGGVPDDTTLRQRSDERFAYPHHSFLMAGLDLDPLLEPRAGPGAANPYLAVQPGASPGVFHLSVTPPMPAPARLSVRLRLAPRTSSEPVRYVVSLQTAGDKPKRLEDNTARPVGDVLVVSAMIEQERWTALTPHALTLTLSSPGVGTHSAVAATVEEVRLTMLPHIPPELHPRR